jgi:hypothetical protein
MITVLPEENMRRGGGPPQKRNNGMSKHVKLAMVSLTSINIVGMLILACFRRAQVAI